MRRQLVDRLFAPFVTLAPRVMMSSSAATRIGTPLEPGTLTKHRKPLNALTGLRFVAASWVLLFHTRLADTLLNAGLPHAGNILRAGKLAVALFFLLSGFILAYTYRGQVKTGGDRRRFWEARFARIWPAYAFSLLLCCLIPSSLPDPRLLTAAIFMVQAWNPWEPALSGAINFVCWSLSTEAFFYLVFPWLQRLIVRRSALQQGILLLLALILVAAANTADQTEGFVPYLGFFHLLPLPIVRLPEFLIGCLMGNLFLEWDGRLPWSGQRDSRTLPGLHGLWTFAGASIALLLLALNLQRWSSLVVAPFVLMLFGLAAERTWLSRLLGTRTLLFGGAISYSMYLLQLPAKYLVHVLLTRLGVPDNFLLTPLMPLTLLALAIPTYLYLEQPSRHGLRWLFARLQTREDRLTPV